MNIKFFFQILALPLMIIIYLSIAIPLALVYLFDWLFDIIGRVVGFDTRYWPLPKGQDEDFRFRSARCEKCKSLVKTSGASHV